MKPIDFYWFSGTGNTLLVAQRMAEVLRTAGVPVTMVAMDKANPAAVNPDHTLGLAFPVAAFSTYPLVWRFVEALPKAAGTPVFMVDTLGRISGFMVGPLKHLLQTKGYMPLAAREIIMPGNYLFGVKPREKCLRKIEKGLACAEAYARDIVTGHAHWRRFSPWPYSWVRCFWHKVEKSAAKDGAKFRVNSHSCTRCGLCVKLCPTANLCLADSGPKFADHCQLCQRCIAFCPVRAISAPGGHSSGLYRGVPIQELLSGLGQPSC